jgi:hypothetical protein
MIIDAYHFTRLCEGYRLLYASSLFNYERTLPNRVLYTIDYTQFGKVYKKYDVMTKFRAKANDENVESVSYDVKQAEKIDRTIYQKLEEGEKDNKVSLEEHRVVQRLQRLQREEEFKPQITNEGERIYSAWKADFSRLKR